MAWHGQSGMLSDDAPSDLCAQWVLPSVPRIVKTRERKLFFGTLRNGEIHIPLRELNLLLSSLGTVSVCSCCRAHRAKSELNKYILKAPTSLPVLQSPVCVANKQTNKVGLYPDAQPLPSEEVRTSDNFSRLQIHRTSARSVVHCYTVHLILYLNGVESTTPRMGPLCTFGDQF